MIKMKRRVIPVSLVVSAGRWAGPTVGLKGNRVS